MDTNISALLDTTIRRIREMTDVNTVVGQPITTPDGITLIPVSRISCAFGSGGGDYPAKEKSGFGGGSGAGVKIEPIGFLVISDGSVRMLNITPPAANSVDRIIEKAPEIIELAENLIKKHQKK